MAADGGQRKRRRQPGFVALIAAAPAAIPGCVIEFESADGSKCASIERRPLHRTGRICCVRGGTASDDTDHRADAGAGSYRAGGWKKGYRFVGTSVPEKVCRGLIFRMCVRVSQPQWNGDPAPDVRRPGLLACAKTIVQREIRLVAQAVEPARPMEAYEAQLLMAAGDLSRLRAAPMWRRVNAPR